MATFEDHAIVLTGASSGIGREMALQLSDQGARLALGARRIVRGMEDRRRELVMSARGRLGLWLKLIAPGLVDRIAARAIERGR